MRLRAGWLAIWFS